ncbi:uncharacterized protein MONBRDRAFT_39397, partial [Monosiga brevicollis MX1]
MAGTAPADAPATLLQLAAQLCHGPPFDQERCLIACLAEYMRDLSGDREPTLPPLPPTLFDAASIPSMDLVTYAHRQHEYAHPGCEAIITAFALVQRMVQSGRVIVTPLNEHRLLAVALLLAIKLTKDQYYEN